MKSSNIRISNKDFNMIEALINLENTENIIHVYEEDIINICGYLEILNKDKKRMMTPPFLRFRDFLINYLFFKINTLISRYMCQNMPTDRRLRSTKQKFEKYDEIIKKYIPRMKEMTKKISEYVSNKCSNYKNSDFTFENAWQWDQVAYY